MEEVKLDRWGDEEYAEYKPNLWDVPKEIEWIACKVSVTIH